VIAAFPLGAAIVLLIQQTAALCVSRERKTPERKIRWFQAVRSSVEKAFVGIKAGPISRETERELTRTGGGSQ
jgi:hypothetical protein